MRKTAFGPPLVPQEEVESSKEKKKGDFSHVSYTYEDTFCDKLGVFAETSEKSQVFLVNMSLIFGEN